MIVAFTGPEDPQAHYGVSHARALVATALQELWVTAARAYPDLELRTGAAKGVDSLAFYAGVATFPKAQHHVLVPAGWRYNQDLVGFARQEGYKITRIEGGPLKRNDALVAGANLLIAFPQTMHEILRSGTWSTIRRAWKQGIMVRYYPLDGQSGPVIRLDSRNR